MNEIIDLLKKYTYGKKNTENVEISVLQLNRVIKALEQKPFIIKRKYEMLKHENELLIEVIAKSKAEISQISCETPLGLTAVEVKETAMDIIRYKEFKAKMKMAVRKLFIWEGVD